jgi:hypothetical protein
MGPEPSRPQSQDTAKDELAMSISLRREFLSGPIFSWARRVMPEMSDTERAALEAGDVWWDVTTRAAS